jgi:ribosomal protein S1
MKLSTALFTSALAIGLSFGFTTLTSTTAEAAKVKGKIEAVMKEGRQVKIGGKTYFISGSRSNICIKGKCDQDRGMLKKGMSCSGTTSSKKKGMEFKKVSCK